MKYMISDLEDITADGSDGGEEKFYLILYTDNILMKNPADYMKFFHPDAICIVPQGKEFPQDLEPEYTVIIYSGKPLAGIPQAAQTDTILYRNRKRGETVSLYRGVIGGEDPAGPPGG